MCCLILASQSAIRAELLKNAGIAYLAIAANVDEDVIKQSMQGKNPEEVALALAEAKALKISAKKLNDYVLGCDQILVFEQEIFDKPKSITEARAHLQRLRGQKHVLISAQVVCLDGKTLWKNTQKAYLEMRGFSDDFLEKYLEQLGDCVCGSVGGYKIEGLGAQLFAAIDGEQSTIQGLPIFPLMEFLRSQNILMS